MAEPSDVPRLAPPLSLVSPTDKGGLIVVLTALAMCFVLVAFVIRLYVRMAVSGFRLDDCVLTVASVVSCIQSSVVFAQVHKGFGGTAKDLKPAQLTSMQKTAYASDILFVFTLLLSKYCVGFLFMRLTPDPRQRVTAWAIMAASTVWGVISIFLLAIRCHPSHPWADLDDHCSGLFSRWQFIGALDIMTEVALFCMSVYLVYGLQMSMKSKAIVVGAFGVRLPVIIAAALHLRYLHLQMLSADPTLAGAYTVVCAQLELGYGLMASSVPCLKPFMSAFEGPFRPPQKSSNLQSTDYPFTTYRSGNSKRLRSASDHRIGSCAVGALSSADERALRPDGGMYQATVTHRDQGPEDGAGGGGEHASIDSGDSRQLIIKKDMVIKKEVKWSVEREGGEGASQERDKDAITIVKIEERNQ